MSRWSQNAMKIIGFYFVRPQEGQLVLNVWLRRCKWSYIRRIPCVYGDKAEASCLCLVSWPYIRRTKKTWKKSIVLKRFRIKKHRLQQNQIFGMPISWRDMLQFWSTHTEGSKYKRQLKLFLRQNSGVLHKQNHRSCTEHTETNSWYGLQNTMHRVRFCFRTSQRGRLGLKLQKQEGNEKISHTV
jgi:hypothetical protein